MFPAPIADRVIVQKEAGDEATEGGILIPDTAQRASDIAVLVAVGPGALDKGVRIAMDTAVGDRVVVAKYAGTEISYNGDVYWLMKDQDILAIVEASAETDVGGDEAVIEDLGPKALPDEPLLEYTERRKREKLAARAKSSREAQGITQGSGPAPPTAP
jgi:chaperonin GroES